MGEDTVWTTDLGFSRERCGWSEGKVMWQTVSSKLINDQEMEFSFQEVPDPCASHVPISQLQLQKSNLNDVFVVLQLCALLFENNPLWKIRGRM